jgi:hypothetical protein
MRELKTTLFCLLALLLAGCAGYHLGPVSADAGPAGSKSVEVAPFNNQTMQPRLGDAVTQALRERMQSDGTYRLSTSEHGDIVLTGVITDYNRTGASYLRTDVATAENFRVEVTACVTALDRATGRKLLDNVTVHGYTLVESGTDLADAERQALPLLAEDLARNTVALLTEGAW